MKYLVILNMLLGCLCLGLNEELATTSSESQTMSPTPWDRPLGVEGGTDKAGRRDPVLESLVRQAWAGMDLTHQLTARLPNATGLAGSLDPLHIRNRSLI